MLLFVENRTIFVEQGVRRSGWLLHNAGLLALVSPPCPRVPLFIARPLAYPKDVLRAQWQPPVSALRAWGLHPALAWAHPAWACGTPVSTNPQLLGMLARRGLVQPTGTGELTAWAFDAESWVTVTMGRVRPTSRRVRCLKAVSKVSLPGSCHSSPSADDPLLPDDIFMGDVGLLIPKLTYTVIWAPAAARPKPPFVWPARLDGNGLLAATRPKVTLNVSFSILRLTLPTQSVNRQPGNSVVQERSGHRMFRGFTGRRPLARAVIMTPNRGEDTVVLHFFIGNQGLPHKLFRVPRKCKASSSRC